MALLGVYGLTSDVFRKYPKDGSMEEQPATLASAKCTRPRGKGLVVRHEKREWRQARDDCVFYLCALRALTSGFGA